MYWTITKGLEAAAMIIDREGHIPWLYFQTETANSPLGIALGNLPKISPNPASTIGKNTWSLTDWQRIWDWCGGPASLLLSWINYEMHNRATTEGNATILSGPQVSKRVV